MNSCGMMHTSSFPGREQNHSIHVMGFNAFLNRTLKRGASGTSEERRSRSGNRSGSALRLVLLDDSTSTSPQSVNNRGSMHVDWNTVRESLLSYRRVVNRRG